MRSLQTVASHPQTVVLTFTLALSACASEPTPTPDEVGREAEAQFRRAVALLDEGELLESWRAVQEMNGIVDAFLDPVDPRRRVGRSDDKDLVAMGRPLREWQAEWNRRYRLRAETAWPTIRQAIEDETVPISVLKGYVDTFLGRRYLERVDAEYDRLEPVLRRRRARQYWYSCRDMGDLCEVVRQVLKSKMPPGMLTTSWTGDVGDYRGRVEVGIRVLREVSYRSGRERRGRIPQSAEVSLTILTNGGASKWDGVHRFTIEAPLPSRIAPEEIADVTERHWENLRRSLDAEMAAWPSTH